MTKAVIVDLVLLRINGGVLSAESAVWRVDILAYLPGAINYVLTKQENIQLKEEGDREVPGEFVAAYYDLPILKDDARNEYYIELPELPIAFRSNRGIRLLIDNCNNTYAPLRETAIGGLKRLLKMLGDKGMYWYRGMKRVAIYNAPKLANKINAYIIKNINSYGLNDELPIPAGMEPEVINILYQYFSGERQAPADRITDEKDLN